MAHILLIVGGGIAAYKAAELIRLARKAGHRVTPVLTAGGAHFVTPMSLAALAESPVYTSLWDLKDEAEMGHIQLSRAADLVLVCPATADLIARMAAGIADDLATTLLLATDKPVVVAPAMNVRMWQHEATQANVATLRARGVTVHRSRRGRRWRAGSLGRGGCRSRRRFSIPPRACSGRGTSEAGGGAIRATRTPPSACGCHLSEQARGGAS